MDERDLSVAFGTLVNGPPLVAMADPPGPAYTKVALDATKFIYQMIKDSKPTSDISYSSSIRVLNDQDADWGHYVDIADEPTPHSFHYTIQTVDWLVWLQPLILDIAWQTVVTRSKSSLLVSPAYYIPSLFPVFQVNFVDWNTKVDASYKIARPTNVASSLYTPVNACLPYIVTHQYSSDYTTQTAAWNRVANARFGIDRDKCWTSPDD